MCIENSAAYNPNSPAADRRITLYWIGWAFFGITITSIFIAGVMVSMYKMNAQDSMMAKGYNSYNSTVPKETNNDVIHVAQSQPHSTPTHRPPLTESNRPMTSELIHNPGHSSQNPDTPTLSKLVNGIPVSSGANSVSTSAVTQPSSTSSSTTLRHESKNDMEKEEYDQ